VGPATRVQGQHDKLLVQGEMAHRLYYLIRGHAQISKDGQSAKISPGAFLGEIAFLTKNPATANVSLDGDAECLSWTHEALTHIMNKEVSIDIAIRGLLNHDLARKVAQSSLSQDASKIGDSVPFPV
jgi:CRP-like cAMP-binding protein